MADGLLATTQQAPGWWWVCAFCGTHNHFPANYGEIAENNLPPELFPSYTTLEYTVTQRPQAPPPVFLWVVDTCMPEDEMDSLKQTLELTISLLPENAYIGIITYGTMVHVYATMAMMPMSQHRFEKLTCESFSAKRHSLPPSGLLRALSRWASRGKGQLSNRGAGFQLLYLVSRVAKDWHGCHLACTAPWPSRQNNRLCGFELDHCTG